MLVTHFGLRSSSPFEAAFYPFGFPVKVRSNSEAVIAIARDEWRAWQRAFDDPPIQLLFSVRPNLDYSGPPNSTFHAVKHRFTVSTDSYNIAIGDTRNRRASATLQQRVVDDRPYFVYHFLDAMAFQLITSLNFTPMHGSTVARNGRGVLITGDSGEGKSSLSYACARRAGKDRWTFVSDDASHLLRRRASERLIVGAPHHIRLRPDAPTLFSELAAFQPALRGNGKLSLQIPTSQLSIATAPMVPVDAIVLPHRVSPAHPKALARLEKIGKDLVRDYCAQWFYHWDPPILAEQQAAFEEMLKGARTFSLEYSDLDAAVDVLDDTD
jgi:hypothetical protein